MPKKKPDPRFPPKKPKEKERLKPHPLPEFEPFAFDWPIGFRFGPRASVRLPTVLDGIFLKYGDGLPVAFLRVLAAGESRMKWTAHRSGSVYYGLLQVSVPHVRKDGKKIAGVLGGYNKAHGTKWTRDDMFNPAANVMVASWYLNRIIALYNRSGIKALKGPRWLDPEWVKLLAAGYNSGPNGVVKVAKWMKAHGAHIDHSAVFRNAKKAGATRHLQNEKKRKYQAAIAAIFGRERRFVPKKGAFAQPAKTGAGIGTGLLLLALLWVVTRRRR